MPSDFIDLLNMKKSHHENAFTTTGGIVKIENLYLNCTKFLSTRCFQHWLDCGRPAAGAPISRELWTCHNTSLCFTSADTWLFSTAELIDLSNMILKSANLENLLWDADLEGCGSSNATCLYEYSNCSNWNYIEPQQIRRLVHGTSIHLLMPSGFIDQLTLR